MSYRRRIVECQPAGGFSSPAGAGLAIICVLAVASFLLWPLVGTARADDDYPYKNALPWNTQNNEWYIDANGNQVMDKGEDISPYGYNYRNCTDFVAWRLHSRNGFNLPGGIGDASAWGLWAQDANRGPGAPHAIYPVNMTPAVGAVAWFSSEGHVAWVESVNSNNTVTIEEYNYPGGSGAWNSRTIATNSANGYIHFKDTRADTTDFNGDGRDDLLSHVTGQGFALAYGTKTGFAEAGVVLPGWAGPVSWAGVGDFDGDGKADLISLVPGQGFALARGTPDGFTEAGVVLPGWGGPVEWAWGMFPSTSGEGFSAPAPTVASLAPTTGISAGGTTVTITGTNLTGTSAVNFGSTAATSVAVVDATHVTCTSPSGSGTVDVTVTTPGGTSATSAADLFAYLAPNVRSLQSGWNILGGAPGSSTGSLILFGWTGSGYASLNAANMQSGQGYWCKAASGDSASLAVVPAPVSVSLSAGWNLIGNPTSATVTLPSGLTVFRFVNGSYVSATSLTPGEGGWVKSPSVQDVLLE